jgi:hypothetical protein
MGLDIYVGSLTRYYAGNWQTIVQQFAAQNGIPVTIVRPKSSRQGLFRRLIDRLRPKGEVAAARAVRRWQKKLQRALHKPDLDWNEDPDSQYFTDKPAWDCYSALVLWAAYDELPRAKQRATAQDWEKDSAYLTNRMNPKARYRHLVANTEFWLPVDFPDPIRFTSPAGDSVVLGSSVRLLGELHELNERT